MLEKNDQSVSVKGLFYKTIMALYNREKQRALIVGAHDDFCGDQPGVDDNASMTAK